MAAAAVLELWNQEKTISRSLCRMCSLTFALTETALRSMKADAEQFTSSIPSRRVRGSY
jgi:hypothetical protein